MTVVSPIPPIPEARGYESSGSAKLMPRYEDITQDGRVILASLMTGLTAVWRTLADSERLQPMMRKGILPILNRILMHGEDGPFSVHTPIHVEGTWRLARERGGERLFLDMWLDAYAPHAQTHGRQPPADAERARVGRLYAEHVVTRPFASTPAERKVTRLDGIPGIPELPEDEHPYEDAASLVAGRALEPARDHVFGMLHTDPNQHVNSLVYPRVFEEAMTARAIERRLTEGPELLLARAIELRYRKPFFAGERALLSAETRPSASGLEAVGAFVPASGDPTKPSTAVAMALERAKAC
ncbi:MAG: hypothetical protein U0270_26935 [Labilithrix sp.]